MKKQNFKKILSLAVILIMASTSKTSLAATELSPNGEVYSGNQLEDNVHILSEDLLKGAEKPGTNAPVHNLSKGAYAFKIDKIGAKVYTNSWFTGKSSITVDITNFEVTHSSPGTTKNKTTVYIYDSKNKSVGSKEIEISGLKGSHTFTGLNSKEKYYVLFTVPTSGNTYSMKGDIK